MGIGASIFLIAVGAVLAWAVDFQTSGVEVERVSSWPEALAGILGTPS